MAALDQNEVRKSYDFEYVLETTKPQRLSYGIQSCVGFIRIVDTRDLQEVKVEFPIPVKMFAVYKSSGETTGTYKIYYRDIEKKAGFACAIIIGNNVTYYLT